MSKEDIKTYQDSILAKFNILAAWPADYRYDSTRKVDEISEVTYIQMLEIAEHYARMIASGGCGNIGLSYNVMWAFDVIHKYFKLKSNENSNGIRW